LRAFFWINISMPTLYNADLKSLQPGTYTHPYDHATKLFLADNYRLLPKQSFLYYVVINFDTSQTQLGGILGSVMSFVDRYQQFENGLLVKRVDLPSFSVDNKTLNAYNRKNIVQTGIKYNPVNMAFHDDAADVITNFWNDYYTYYFRDSDYGAEQYRNPSKYSPRKSTGWGFSPHNGGISKNTQGEIYSLIKNIRVFSLHNKRFTEYMLVNPIITSWNHGKHASDNGSATMENTMTVNYETVKYFTGYINAVSVDGFGLLHYDNTNSPISNSVTNVYSDAGIIGAIDGTAKDLARPSSQYGAGGPLSAILSMYRTYDNLKNVNVENVVKTTIGQVGAGVLNQVINTGLGYVFPSLSGGVTGIDSSQVYTNPTTGATSYAYPENSMAMTIGGIASGIAIGSSLNTSNKILSDVNVKNNRGISTSGISINPQTTKIYDILSNNGEIKLTPGLQPVTGSITSLIIDDRGQVVSSFMSAGTQSGTYNSADPNENMKTLQVTADESDNKIIIRTYYDGTQVVFSESGQQVALIPGAMDNSKNINVNPVDARVLAQNGTPVPAGQVQYYTDPESNVTYVVGGSTAAQITNYLSGANNGSAGLYAGRSVDPGVSKLNNSVVTGRSMPNALSASAGVTIGVSVNSGLQPIVDNVTGDVLQGWDSFSGRIKNVITTWTGAGGYNPANPTENIVARQTYSDGSSTFIFKDGTVRQVAADGTETITNGTGNSGLLSWFNGALGQNRDRRAATGAPGTVWTDGRGDPSIIPVALTKMETAQLAAGTSVGIGVGPSMDPTANY